MLCCRALLAYMVTNTLSSYPSVFRGKAMQLLLPVHSLCGVLLFCSRHSWLGHLAARVTPP